MELNKIIQGDCLEVLKTFPENSIDSIVTDPPYELGFMGKSWDNTGIANNPLMWAECLRVLKPGGYLLSFGGTRTYHRMASAIEDAGFEVRDMIEWVYGSGFPKSLNIGKVAKKFLKTGNASWNGTGDSSNGALGYSKLQHKQGYRPEDYSSKHQNKEDYSELECPNCAGRGDINIGANVCWECDGKGKIKNEWKGWGTALKPAHEPICMARKPLAEKTVAENVLKYGTGGINIDESRVGTEGGGTHCDNRDEEGNCLGHNNAGKSTSGETIHAKQTGEVMGRFPANLIHDNSEEVRECFPDSGKGNGKGAYNYAGREYDNKDTSIFNGDKPQAPSNFNDSGNASRFFKSIKKDLQYSPKHAILKLCENNISVNNAENNLKTTSQIELVANIFSALKSATPNLDLLNQNLNALFVEKSADSTEIDFVAKCVAIKELPEELVSQQEYTVFQDFMEDYKKCSLTQNPVSAEKLGNTDITQIMTSLLKLSGYVLAVIEENISSENQEGQKCDYRSLVYIPKASKSERNKGCEELEEKERIDYGGFHSEKGLIENNRNPENRKPTTNNHPTVKPLELMSYLIKMVTKPGGVVLDPFAGSGSTLVAAKQNGFQYIGIEMTAEYIPIIEARLKGIKKDNTLF